MGARSHISMSRTTTIVWGVVWGVAVAGFAGLGSPGDEQLAIGAGIGLIVAGVQIGYELWPPPEPWSEVPTFSVRGFASKLGMVTWIAALLVLGLDGWPASLYVAVGGGMLFILARATGYMPRRSATSTRRSPERL